MRRDAVGMLVESAGNPYLIPLSAIEAVQRIDPSKLERVGGASVLSHHGRAIQVVPLQAALLGRSAPVTAGDERPLAIVVSGANETVALMVDRIEGEREMSVRPLGPELRRFDHLAGVTLIGDGRTVLVLNMMGLVSRALDASRAPTPESSAARTVLVVDDAVTSRLLYRTFLEAAGYRVLMAGDGQEALEVLASNLVDAILADVRMPLMDGRELTRRVRTSLGLKELPVLLVSSLGSEDERREGLRAGANAYIVKSETSPSEILEVLSGLVS
jgi:two-component system chemotaxis sensor kinase CheA